MGKLVFGRNLPTVTNFAGREVRDRVDALDLILCLKNISTGVTVSFKCDRGPMRARRRTARRRTGPQSRGASFELNLDGCGNSSPGRNSLMYLWIHVGFRAVQEVSTVRARPGVHEWSLPIFRGMAQKLSRMHGRGMTPWPARRPLETVFGRPDQSD
jgi:hypothetical protein